MCISADDIVQSTGKLPRIFRTNTITWAGDARPEFPCYDARVKYKTFALGYSQRELHFDLEPLQEENAELAVEDDLVLQSIQDMYMQPQPSVHC